MIAAENLVLLPVSWKVLFPVLAHFDWHNAPAAENINFFSSFELGSKDTW